MTPLAAPAVTGVGGSVTELEGLCADVEVVLADEVGVSIDEAVSSTVPAHPIPGTAMSYAYTSKAKYCRMSLS